MRKPMDPRLRAMVDEVKAENSSMRVGALSVNAFLDAPTRLGMRIADSEIDREVSEDELAEAAREVGVSPDDVPGWLESLASWY